MSRRVSALARPTGRIELGRGGNSACCSTRGGYRGFSDLLRVEPWLTSKAMFAGQLYAIPNLTELEEDVEAAAKDYLARTLLQVPHDVPCHAVVQRGFPTITIEAYAEQKQVDLVVMSTHGSGGLTRLVVGSNADRLVRSGVPTLLIHP